MPEPADHRDARGFRNPAANVGLPTFGAVWKMLREPRSRWPRHAPVEQRKPPAREAGRTVVTWIGHSTFLIQTPAGAILTDPFFSQRASPVQWAGPRRARAPGVALADLPDLALVLLSHNHYDHCDLPALRALARRHRRAVVVTPLGNAPLLAPLGFLGVEELDWWQAATRAPMPVTLTPAQHFSGRTPWDRNRALWGGFAFEAGGRRILFAGDSGYGPHFADIGRRLGAPDLALLPIGAYEPRWFMRPIHVNPEEAVRAHVDLGSRRSVAMHWGTIQLTPEAMDAPPAALAAARAAAGLAAESFVALDCGASITL